MVREDAEVEAPRVILGDREDRFDHVPKTGRIGAHRLSSRPRHFWTYFLASLLGFAVLTTLGILWVKSVGSITENPLAQRTEVTEAPPATQPELDPKATVIVLDGIEDDGALASAVDKVITKEEWGEIVFSGPASSEEVPESYVYYAAPNDEAAALGLAEQLGGLPVAQTDEFAALEARLIVVLGTDYAGPGAEE